MGASGELHPAPKATTVGAFITDEGLDELARFKYVSGPYTPLDNVLNPWWFFVARLVPSWCSPNAVTSLGLLVALLSIAAAYVVSWLDPSSVLSGHRVFLLIGVCMFFYQTMDAVDGKHARATSQSTPLGAIYDHGCDAIVATAGVVALEIASSTLASEAEESRTMISLIGFLLPLVSFFCAQWEHLHTHAMPAGGVTEAQFCGMGTMLVAARWGPLFFQTDMTANLPSIVSGVLTSVVGGPNGIVLKRVMNSATIVFASVLAFGSVKRSVQRGSWKCLTSLAPMVLCVCLSTLLFVAETGVFARHRFLCQFAAGLVMTDLNVRMVIAAVCRFDFPALQAAMLPFALSAIAGVPGLLPALGCDADLGLRVHHALICFAVAWQVFSVVWVSANTISRVCAHLNIPFLAPVPEERKTK
eukprot:TRINITY_DN947_c0_g3_i1.p1 TRINITY_DN947_c0_g3~~TRINITY_DN947_c0_g3_i1.p1  ORF type:complete len:416 (+),score=63.71 TRINITY_DN947_c0_g3_i1:160-1407(+)